jgi:hypothetical protein
VGRGGRPHDAAGKGRPSQRATSPAAPRPPDAGGLRPRLGNQRQDDHGIDDRRDPARLRPRSRPQSRRIQRALGCGDRLAGAVGGDRRLRGRRGLAADPGDGARPPRDRARKSLPRSTRHLRRARCPGDGLEEDAGRWGPVDARAQRRRCPCRKPGVDPGGARPAPDFLLWHRGPRSGPLGDRAHGRLDPLPGLRPAALVRRPAAEPPRALPLRCLRRQEAQPGNQGG